MKKIVALLITLGVTTHIFSTKSPTLDPAANSIQDHKPFLPKTKIKPFATCIGQYIAANPGLTASLIFCFSMAMLPPSASYLIQHMEGGIEGLLRPASDIFLINIIATIVLVLVGPLIPNSSMLLNNRNHFDGIGYPGADNDKRLPQPVNLLIYSLKSLSIYPFISSWINAYNKDDDYYKKQWKNDYNSGTKFWQGASECIKTLGVQAAYLLLTMIITAIFIALGITIDAILAYTFYKNNYVFKNKNVVVILMNEFKKITTKIKASKQAKKFKKQPLLLPANSFRCYNYKMF